MKEFRSIILLAVAAFSVAALAGTASAHQAKQLVKHVNLTVVPGGKKGPDGKMHDAFLGTDSFKVRVGEKVVITVRNTDGGQHSFTAPGLGVDQVFPGAKGKKASVTTFSFVAKKAGSFQWFCRMVCDGGAAHWAMNPKHENYMAGVITVTA